MSEAGTINSIQVEIKIGNPSALPLSRADKAAGCTDAIEYHLMKRFPHMNAVHFPATRYSESLKPLGVGTWTEGTF